MAILSLSMLLLVFVYPILVLRPLIQLAKQSKGQQSLKRYSIVDLVSLVFLIQLAFIIPGFTEADLSDMPMIGLGLLVLLPVIVWLAGLRALNQIGVADWRKRLVCVGLTFPFAIGGGFFLVMTLSMIANQVFNFENPAFTLPNVVLAVLGFAAVMIATFKSAQWIAKDPNSRPQVPPLVDQTDNQ